MALIYRTKKVYSSQHRRVDKYGKYEYIRSCMQGKKTKLHRNNLIIKIEKTDGKY